MAENRISWAETLVVGVGVFGVVGTGAFVALVAGFVAIIRSESPWNDLDVWLVLCMVAAAAVPGTLAWAVMVRTRDARRWRGACAGVFVGFAAPVLFFAFLAALAVASDRKDWNMTNASSMLLIGTAMGVLASFLGLGWLTAPLGAALGFLVVDYRSTARRKALPAGDVPSPPGIDRPPPGGLS